MRDSETHRGVPDAGLTDPPQGHRRYGGRGAGAAVTGQTLTPQTRAHLHRDYVASPAREPRRGSHRRWPPGPVRRATTSTRSAHGPNAWTPRRKPVHLPGPSKAKSRDSSILARPGERAHCSRTEASPSVHPLEQRRRAKSCAICASNSTTVEADPKRTTDSLAGIARTATQAGLRLTRAREHPNTRPSDTAGCPTGHGVHRDKS